MHIDESILNTYGAVITKHKKGEIIFEEGSTPRFYYQVKTGCIKMISTNEEGRVFTQGVFGENQSFGEPPLLLNQAYPSSAISGESTTLIKISQEKFLKLLDNNPQIAKTLLFIFAERIYSKATIAQILVCHSPEEKIICFFNKLKRDAKVTSDFVIPLTRQEIADSIGLRVETVIRCLIKLSNLKKVTITNHKVIY